MKQRILLPYKPRKIKLYIHHLFDIIILNIDPKYTIKMIKDDLHKITGYIVKKQKLFFNNIELKDDKDINFYNIKIEDILFSTIIDL